MDKLTAATAALCARVDALRFAPPVTHVYNPLDYARAPYELYLKKYGHGQKRVIFLGMNPGPFGMMQTGVPFGEVAAARDFLKVEARVERPARETPVRPIEGYACARSEVSGRRLWGLFAARFGSPEKFAEQHFVLNYCPLAFLEGGRNFTPDKLPKAEREPLYAACDDYLRTLIDIMRPAWLIGVGKFARVRAEAALAGYDISFGDILHPSPASPAANRGWAEAATRQLEAAGVWPLQDGAGVAPRQQSAVAPKRQSA